MTNESDSVLRVSEIAPQLPTDIKALQALLVAARPARCRYCRMRFAKRPPSHLLRQLQQAQIS
jgi:hypothetical protein